MREDTPLKDVALFLGADTARRLMGQPAYVQNSCLEAVRTYLVRVEEQRITLDPIEMEEHLDRLVRDRMINLGRL